MEVEKVDGDVKVTLTWIGEGYSGDYDPDDPKDEKLLRFDVYRRVYPWNDDTPVWEAVDCGSYCTMLPADTSEAKLENAVHILMRHFKPLVERDVSVKRIAEQMSYLNPGLVPDENETIYDITWQVSVGAQSVLQAVWKAHKYIQDMDSFGMAGHDSEENKAEIFISQLPHGSDNHEYRQETG